MPMNTGPTVSVIIPTRNRPTWLGRALHAIARQSYRDYEVLVIDDGSDGTTLEEYAPIWSKLDDRFILARSPYPGMPGTGPAAARNRGIQQARGEFVAFCDDDDYWCLDDHLAVAVEAQRQNDADLYFANMRGERDGHITIPDWFPDSPQLLAGPKLSRCSAIYEVGLPSLTTVMQHHVPHLNTCVVRRRLLRQVGGFWEPVRGPEDLELLLRLADRARRVLYRADHTAVFNTQARASVINDMACHDLQFMRILAAQHARAVCQRPEVRRCARSLESWSMRSWPGRSMRRVAVLPHYGSFGRLSSCFPR